MTLITKSKVKNWDISLLKRASKLGAKVFTYGDLDIVRSELKKRKR